MTAMLYISASGFANIMRCLPLQPRAVIHFETAMRQGLLHSQTGH
jgi:hypothetical protein